MPSVYERGALPHTRGPQRGSRVGGPAPARRSWGPHARLPPPLKLRRGSPKRLRREGGRSFHPNAQEPRVGDPGSQARRARLPLYGAYNENKILVMRPYSGSKAVFDRELPVPHRIGTPVRRRGDLAGVGVRIARYADLGVGVPEIGVVEDVHRFGAGFDEPVAADE